MLDKRRYEEAAAKTDIVGDDSGEGTNSYGLSTGGRQHSGDSDPDDGSNHGAVVGSRGNYLD